MLRRPSDQPKEFALSDVGNAERFREMHQQDIRYCTKWHQWLEWTGKRWQEDTSGRVYRLSKATIRNIEQEARQLQAKLDKTEQEEERAEVIAKWAKVSQERKHVDAIPALARGEPDISIDPSVFDQDPLLLNCVNGTIDLRTGQLRPNKRSDYLTKMCPVAYDPKATSPLWDAFLDRVQPNIRVRKYLQRATGYSATGDVSERVVIVAWGGGRNGKSFYVNTVAAVLGDYAVHFPKELLMAKQYQDHPATRAILFNSRFAWTGETSLGRNLDEGMVKELTGGDAISARRMRENPWEFRPTHTLWLMTNYKPVIRGTDTGIWDRIRLVPFTTTIPQEQQDKQLTAKLRGEYPGILRWIVEGCLDWQKNALAEPPEVDRATDEYREEMDTLGGFLAERCVLLPEAKVTHKALYQDYVSWATESNERAVASRELSKRLKERGYVLRPGTKGAKTWEGIGLQAML